jgi:Glycine zipper 2TM domain
MKLILIIAGLAAVTACSGGRERRVASAERVEEQPDLTLPDTLSRRDTSVLLPSRNEPPVSPVEQQVAPPEPKVERPTPTPRRKRPPAVATPAPSPADTTVQAYAPTQPADSVSAVDQRGVDTITAGTDTAPSPVADSSRPKPDSISVARADSAGAPARDTTREPSSVGVADTSSTPSADSMVAPAAVVAPTSPARSATAAARTLPVGTEIHAALDDSITSRRDTVGQTVSAHVMENVIGPDGKTLIAAGTPVQFTVSRLRASRSKNSQGRFALRADGIALKGQLQPVQAEVGPVPRELRGRGVTGSDAAKVGGGAAAGAVLGRVIGGNTRGTVIGGVAGAAAGAVVATQTPTRDVVVKAKTPVVLVLTAPLVAP